MSPSVVEVKASGVGPLEDVEPGKHACADYKIAKNRTRSHYGPGGPLLNCRINWANPPDCGCGGGPDRGLAILQSPLRHFRSFWVAWETS